MNVEKWNESNEKILFDCFMDVEKRQYPEYHHKKLDERKDKVEKLILEFGGSFVTIHTYTNLMSPLASLTFDVYDNNRWQNGNIDIYLGSETHELGASRGQKKGESSPGGVHMSTKDTLESFNFQTWEWEKVEE